MSGDVRWRVDPTYRKEQNSQWFVDQFDFYWMGIIPGMSTPLRAGMWCKVDLSHAARPCFNFWQLKRMTIQYKVQTRTWILGVSCAASGRQVTFLLKAGHYRQDNISTYNVSDILVFLSCGSFLKQSEKLEIIWSLVINTRLSLSFMVSAWSMAAAVLATSKGLMRTAPFSNDEHAENSDARTTPAASGSLLA